MIEDPAAKLEEYLTHRVAREQQVVDGLAAVDGPIGTQGLVERIYTDVPEFLHPMARRSVWAHLRKLDHDGRATSVDVDDPDADWALA